MKDSGVKWIGDIPDNWEVKKLNNLAKVINGFNFSSNSFSDDGIRVIRISDFNVEGLVDDKIVRYKYSYPEQTPRIKYV